MDVTVRFTHFPSASEAQSLEDLATKLSQFDPSVQRTEPEAGKKDGGLALAIAIVGAASSALGTMISAIALWKTSIPNCSVTLKRGNITESIGNLTPKEALALVDRLREEDIAPVRVEVSRQ